LQKQKEIISNYILHFREAAIAASFFYHPTIILCFMKIILVDRTTQAIGNEYPSN